MHLVIHEPLRMPADRIGLTIPLPEALRIRPLEPVQPSSSIRHELQHVYLPLNLFVTLLVKLPPRVQDRNRWVVTFQERHQHPQPLFLTRPQMS